VDTLRASAAAAPGRSGVDGGARLEVDPSTIEPDVRRLASPELEGRKCGTRGNALAREHLLARLRGAGLGPLFDGLFEQPTFVGPRQRTRHGTNVGALWRSRDPGAGWTALLAHYDHLGVVRGRVRPGADDNASSVAILLAIADAIGRARPALPNHLAFLFPDAEEPPAIRTERMGSSWFWRHPPFPIERLRCAIVLDLMGGISDLSLSAAGLGNLLFVLGAEASPGLAALALEAGPEPGVEPLRLGLPLIETYPYLPGRRFSLSDYHALRPLGRPFLFLSTGRSSRYHTAQDTADSLDFAGFAPRARWCARLALLAAQGRGELGWTDCVADPLADARATARLLGALGDGNRFPGMLRRALLADRRRVEAIQTRLESGGTAQPEEYRAIQLACLRAQAAMWHPSGWWFALW